MKIISLFNHKGGVSKTTTAYNLGWSFSKKGKKVLLVDGDPQCNLSGIFLGDYFDDYYTNSETKEHNIMDGVKSAFEGKPKPIEAINCYNRPNNDNLFILPGHMNLSEYDATLNLALTTSQSITTLQNLPGAFYELILKCCDKYSIDYVLIDMNPSLSAINQTLFMISDYFIVPTNPDPFSIMALKTLTTVLPKWKKWSIDHYDSYKEAAYPLPKKEMRFIGEIIQRFNLRNSKAAKPYQSKIQEIIGYVETDFVPKLAEKDMLVNINKFIESKQLTNHCLAEIPDFGSLVQNANDHFLPVVALTEETINYKGNVLEQLLSKKEDVSNKFDTIVDIIIGVDE